jgi:hypothetical protein
MNQLTIAELDSIADDYRTGVILTPEVGRLFSRTLCEFFFYPHLVAGIGANLRDIVRRMRLSQKLAVRP